VTIVDSLRIAYWLFRLDRNKRWSRTRIRKYQGHALTNILRHAAETVPYYRSLRLEGSALSPQEYLARFPVLTKRDIQDLGDDLLSADFRRAELRYSRTSGTSGEPTTTFYDRNCWLLSKYALKIHRLRSNGIGLFKNIVIISEQSPEQLQSIQHLSGTGVLFKQRFLSIHDSIADHLPVLREPGIDSIYAFPSYLDDLINHCEARKITLPSIPVVFTSSEVLQNTLRTRIERFFGSRVCDIYGSTEFKEIAWQCENGTYHLNFESVFIESALDSAMNIGGRSDVLVTSLTNRAMPLIRFRLGDECKLSSAPCPCGLESSSLTDIDGRVIDRMRLPDGKNISPYLLTTVVESNAEIAKYQIIQTAPDDVEIRYVVKSRGLSATDIQSIQSALRVPLGDTVTVRIRAVAEILPTAAGKHRVFIQAMGPEA